MPTSLLLQAEQHAGARNRRLAAVPPRRGRRPAAPPRMPLSLALVLDRSGSMDGEKLDVAREGAIRAVRSLRAEDRVSVLTYNEEAGVVIARRPPTTRRSAWRSNRGITDRQTIVAHAAELRGRGVSTSTLGAGSDFGEVLLRMVPARTSRLHSQHPDGHAVLTRPQHKGPRVGHCSRLTSVSRITQIQSDQREVA